MEDDASGRGGWRQCRADVHTVHVNAVEAALRKAAKDLTGLGQRWAIVGGFAVSARAEPRFTRDVDIAVAVANDYAAESLVRRLLTQQYRLLASVEQDAVGSRRRDQPPSSRTCAHCMTTPKPAAGTTKPPATAASKPASNSTSTDYAAASMVLDPGREGRLIRIRCTVQACTIAAGQTLPPTSGSPP